MLRKIDRYYQTLKYLKKSQVIYLIKNRLERGKKAVTDAKAPKYRRLSLWMPGLDARPEYLKRFCLEEIMEGKVTLLYTDGKPGGKNWADSNKSHLWNFNLHYLEFLIPLAAAYREEKDVRYYETFKDYCRRWISDNREGTGDGWHPYTISLRLTNLWICMDGFGRIIREDTDFIRELNNSMYAQYLHLQKRMELHLLGNHYFENLKAVMLGALYFREPGVYGKYKKKFQREIREQILPDGVHYERSLMYHKIILEDMMRVAKAVRSRDLLFCQNLLDTIRKMADAGWSLERGMGRTPLFNDAGDNVARPWKGCLLDALEDEFEIQPEGQGNRAFPDAGYYCLEHGEIKIIMDAGEIAPSYMPGHGHCDGLSFELAWCGNPVFVNSGTGQYQGPLRAYFRSTAAHNTIVTDQEEQSECWGEHRVGRRIRDVSGSCESTWIKGSLTAYSGKRHSRMIRLVNHNITDNVVEIQDRVRGHASAYFHLAPDYEYVVQGQKVLVRSREENGKIICEIQTGKEDTLRVHREGTICSYAPEFGKTEQIQVLKVCWDADGTWHGIRMRFLEPDGE